MPTRKQTNQACKQILDKYTNYKLKKIVNVFQVQFKDFKAPGFGDYVRGCFCMTQLIKTLNEYCGTEVVFEMDLRNHPMSKWIETSPRDSSIDYPNLNNFHIDSLKVPQDETSILFQHILRQTTEYMNKLKDEVFYCFCCKYEVYDEIREVDKELIRSFLRPRPEMQIYIKTTLDSFGLKPKEYSVLHIRWRDEDAFGVTHKGVGKTKPLSEEQLSKMNDLVCANLDAAKHYILMTTHNDIKRFYLSDENSKGNLKIQLGEICHVGQDPDQTDEQVRDTMLDFFLISLAADVLAFSPYNHGTGFSQECAKLYNVPHKLIKISM
jgi:hypothetical protein